MYEELVNNCRNCLESYCRGCKYEHLQGPGNFVRCMNALLSEAANAIEELSERLSAARFYMYGQPLVNKWISVEDRLPKGGDKSGEFCETVCLLLDDGSVTSGWMNGITGKVYFLDSTNDYIRKMPMSRVTHWMPLPEPPKEET